MDTHEDEASHQDEGAANLDIMVGLLENDETKHHKDRIMQLQNEVLIVGLNRLIHNTLMAFVSSSLSIMTDTVKKSEHVTSATPHLSSLQHSYFVKNQPGCTCIAETRHIKIQPIARRRQGIVRRSQCAPSGGPLNAKLLVKNKHGKQDHTKRKHSLSWNVSQTP